MRFPFLPKNAVSYFNNNDINEDELKNLWETTTNTTKNNDLVKILKDTWYDYLFIKL